MNIQVHEHTFTIKFHVLPLCGVDVVLGVEWLKTLGPVLTDYTSLSMKFITEGKFVEMQGEHEQEDENVSTSQLRRIKHT